VVLPPVPTEQEIETFLTLMGHFSRQTGFPALRVTVAGPDALKAGAQTDFLVLGTGDDQPGFDRLAGELPVSLGSGEIQVHDTQGVFEPLHRAWWKSETGEHPESGELTVAGTPDAVIEGIESPFVPHGGRSIVLIHLKDATAFEPFLNTFLTVQQSSDISGPVSIFHGNHFQSVHVGAKIYHVGVLPWWTGLTLWFLEHPWLASLILVFLCFVMAVWLRQWLRGRARDRLRMID
jgi:cellulose synthase (UDP-forming)